MKKYLIIFTVFLFYSLAQAQTPQSIPFETPPVKKTAKPKKSDHPNPCAVIEEACKKGNYTKFIHRDCVDPILDGHPPTGVDYSGISNQQIMSCKMDKPAKKK